MQKLFLPFLLSIATIVSISAQTAPAIQWQKSLGGSTTDYANNIKQTKDGGYIVVGYAYSTDSDVVGSYGLGDCWIIKFDAIGNVQWKKTYGGSHTDEAVSVVETNDGGYVVGGDTNSPDGNVVGGVHGTTNNPDYWVFKIDSLGTLLWQKVFGGSEVEIANAIIKTNDNGFIIAGWSESSDGDVTDHHGAGQSQTRDYWLVKLDSNGTKLWAKSYGGTDSEQPYGMVENSSGFIYVCGGTLSNDGDVSGNHGYSDYWIIKIDSIGDLIWQKCLGGTNADIASSIEITNNGGCIVSGYSTSTNGDVIGNHGISDAFTVKLDANGNIEWKKCFGGSDYDLLNSIKTTWDGGFILAGYSNSTDGDVSGMKGNGDFWVLRIDSLGNILWQKCLGGTNFEEAFSIVETTDKGFAIAGESNSSDGDITMPNKGGYDYWVVKLLPDPLPLRMMSYGLKIVNEKYVENIWTTSNEINVSHFNVQRSINGKNFTTIGQKIANNKNYNEYSFIDNQPPFTNDQLMLYYRIQSIDKDGRIGYSETRQVQINQLTNQPIKIFPNPATDYVIVECKEMKNIRIINQLGQVVFQQIASYPRNDAVIINTKHFVKGVYEVQLLTQYNAVITKTIILQ